IACGLPLSKSRKSSCFRPGTALPFESRTTTCTSTTLTRNFKVDGLSALTSAVAGLAGLVLVPCANPDGAKNNKLKNRASDKPLKIPKPAHGQSFAVFIESSNGHAHATGPSNPFNDSHFPFHRAHQQFRCRLVTRSLKCRYSACYALKLNQHGPFFQSRFVSLHRHTSRQKFSPSRL